MTFSATGAALAAVSFAVLGGTLFTAVMSVKPDAMLSSSKPEPPAMESADEKELS